MPAGKEIHLAFRALTLTPKPVQGPLSGVSEKGVYQSDTDPKEDYYIKKPKDRKVSDIFGEDKNYKALVQARKELLPNVEFDPYTEAPKHDTDAQAIEKLTGEEAVKYAEMSAQLQPFVTHVKELMMANTALEMVAPRVASGIMGDLLKVPENYLFLDDAGKPCTASKSVGALDEFLTTSHVDVEKAQRPGDWTGKLSPPSFADLKIDEEQAEMLGQAYCVALLMGHLDLVNNINLSNFGTVEAEDGSKQLCIVDWGNTLGVGFSGVTAEEGAFKNVQLDPNVPRDEATDHDADISGFKCVVPFDEVVYPPLPRQVVSDLFDLTKNDRPELRAAQRRGFYAACERAESKLGEIQTLVPQLVSDTFKDQMSKEDAAVIQPLVSAQVFQTDGRMAEKNAYQLANIIEGRINSLKEMKEKLMADCKLKDISDERLDKIRGVQWSPQKSTAGDAGPAPVDQKDQAVAQRAAFDEKRSAATPDSTSEPIMGSPGSTDPISPHSDDTTPTSPDVP